jgi:4-alpha-glucanotransferase
LSAFAGEPTLIAPATLQALGLVTDTELEQARGEASGADELRARACARLLDGHALQDKFAAFCRREQSWLEDFALFMALREQHSGAPWYRWPAPYRDRDLQALTDARHAMEEQLAMVRAEQFLFDVCWKHLHEEAARREIALFGDLPIYVAHDSVDVWAAQEMFHLDEQGAMTMEAGVPPDFFSQQGQAWGTPLYRWERMACKDFKWWRRRVERLGQLFDWVRMDHFRGLEAYWILPAGGSPADGRWEPGPGGVLIEALQSAPAAPRLIAEDLGVITPSVEALRDRYDLPGMRVLQFAFDGGADNPHLPHNHRTRAVAYTGTHDNDTTLGWWQNLDENLRDYAVAYLGHMHEPMPWPLIRAALASVAECAVIPMQDLMALGSEARMNHPGTVAENWRWRFAWDDVPEGLAKRLQSLLRLYGRAP